MHTKSAAAIISWKEKDEQLESRCQTSNPSLDYLLLQRKAQRPRTTTDY